jgi:single-strand DNA-binding protein
MNKVILFGNVGKDPEVKTLGKNKVAKFSLATNKVYTNSDGEKVTETSWHNIILWNKLADLAEKFVRKGNSLIIEGEISYRSYENKDGQTIYLTEIIGKELHFAGSKKEETHNGKVDVKAMSNVNDLPGAIASDQDILSNLPPDDLPF